MADDFVAIGVPVSAGILVAAVVLILLIVIVRLIAAAVRDSQPGPGD